MKKYIATIMVITGIFMPVMAITALTTSLPAIRHNGQPHYVYQVQDEESLYGISQKLGWDVDSILASNPDIASAVKKGQLLYYPAPGVSVIDSEVSLPVNNIYIVKSGDSVYGIAKNNGVPIDSIYALNPDARFGIKEGEKLRLSQALSFQPQRDILDAEVFVNEESGESSKSIILDKNDCGIVIDTSDSVIYYTLQDDDSLQSLVKKFNTSIEEIFLLNPGVTETFTPIDNKLCIHVNSEFANGKKQQIVERLKLEILKYKIEENDSWDSLADMHGITVEELKNENPKVSELKKGQKINLPIYKDCAQITDESKDDVMSYTPMKLRDIYNRVHGYDKNIAGYAPVTALLIVRLDENGKKRDLELLRGMLVGIRTMTELGYKVKFKVLEIPENAEIESIYDEIKNENPDIVFTAFEKDFPKNLSTLDDSLNAWTVNIFDAKSNVFATSPNTFNVMTPSEIFNNKAAEYLISALPIKRMYIFDPDESRDPEELSSLLFEKASASEKLPIKELSEVTKQKYLPNLAYIFVPSATKKSEIVALLTQVSELKENNPQSKFIVIGKPSWIVYSDVLNSQFENCDTYIPSRFFSDNDAAEYKQFNSEFASMYSGSPLRSYPGYAAMGYDVVRYFIQSYAQNGGDLNRGGCFLTPLQMDFMPHRQTNQSGFYNDNIYILHFNTSGIDKIKL